MIEGENKAEIDAMAHDLAGRIERAAAGAGV
jgi:hypothetical protein